MNTEPTTVALPSDLLAAVDRVVREGRARSRDKLVESALRHELAELRWSALDAEFRHMADDVEYRRDVHEIIGESDSVGGRWRYEEVTGTPRTGRPDRSTDMNIIERDRADWEDFEAAARRPIEQHIRNSFIKTYKPIMDDAEYRSFDTMEEYRRWCKDNLPDWLGYNRD